MEDEFFTATPKPIPVPEECNTLDDDLDGNVDEDFRGDDGQYNRVDHCGDCSTSCVGTTLPNAISTGCGQAFGVARCVASECAAGFLLTDGGQCISRDSASCLACTTDLDCGELATMGAASCASIAGEQRCALRCDAGCGDGYRCDEGLGLCVPAGGSCSCTSDAEGFSLACALVSPLGTKCAGQAECRRGVLGDCEVPEEICDEVDNDCDDIVDEGFANERGAYSLDIRNCGYCGRDCTIDEGATGLVCGGDPFAPTCVLSCPDAADGIQPGDEIDANLDIADGCECTVTTLTDAPGPLAATGQALDTNCDGADGIVRTSFYVATDGDDAGPGSPTQPFASIAAGMERAAVLMIGSIDIYVASGRYTETVTVVDGARVHGGYRRDFLALDPAGFRSEVRAPSDTTAPGGAALVLENVGERETLIEGMSFYGLDADTMGEAAFGAYVRDPGARVTFRNTEFHAGVPGPGADGASGRAGASPSTDPSVGSVPRAAVEDRGRECAGGPENRVAGGTGGLNSCGAVSPNGGAGGASECPSGGGAQASGTAGGGATRAAGGDGGMDSQGPITGPSCRADVCCGLADFSVPTDFLGPQPGSNGADGSNGISGAGCDNALGSFTDSVWTGDTALGGTSGTPGSGGGGGGAGGGTVMDYFEGQCEFADGLGGGGGGGGAAGCGGTSGQPGTSGAPSVALVLRLESTTNLPAFDHVVLASADGGRGGRGGAGGDGGLGDNGALGGSLSREARTTPTLAGPFGGARGGKGGNGGRGGGGGGGCGGGSIGAWVTGARASAVSVRATTALSTSSDFVLGQGGAAGRGSTGTSDGEAGDAAEVVVQ